MSRSLAGKVGVVTGASRGLGRTLALALADEGVTIAMLARPSPALDEMAVLVPPPNGLVVPCDIADPTSVAAGFQAVVTRFGGIDILINNAAIYNLATVENLTNADISDQIGINLAGPIYAAREAIPHLRVRGGGDIINISSESVELPFPFLSVYAATKAGLETFSRALQAEVRNDKIRVSVLRSGRMADTAGQRDWAPAMQTRFFETIEKTGHAAIAGNSAASVESMAEALIALLRLPPDLRASLIDLRAF